MEHQKLTLLISRKEISSGVQRLAAEIRRDYSDNPPLLLAVLKGSFIFVSDLVRVLGVPATVDFIQVQSYRGTFSTGTVGVSLAPTVPLEGRHVVLVEDIVDMGATVDYLLSWLGKQSPASVKVCALLDKPSARVVPVPIDYLGFTVPNRFVVGYGIDLNQNYRHLPDIYTVSEG